MLFNKGAILSCLEQGQPNVGGYLFEVSQIELAFGTRSNPNMRVAVSMVLPLLQLVAAAGQLVRPGCQTDGAPRHVASKRMTTRRPAR